MTDTIDLRARGLNAFLHPGNPAVIPSTWPTGYLAGRSFTSTLNGQPVTVDIAGDIMTITVSAAATGALTVGDTVAWELVDTTGPDPVVVLTGRWVASNNPAAAVGQSFTIELVDTTITVDVSGQAALATHEADLTAHGLGIVHDWGVDGWTPFTPSVMTDAQVVNGAPQTFALSVANGAGVVTGTQPAPAVDHRVAYLRDGTEWEDSEITSLIYGPGPGVVWSGANAQQWHLHRVQETAPGVMTGIAIWTSVVFGGDYRFLHGKLVDWTGSAIGQATTTIDGSGDSGSVDRQLVVTTKERAVLGQGLDSHQVMPHHLYGLANGTIVTIDCDDNTFDITDVAATVTPNNAVVAAIHPSAVDTVARTFGRGTIRPSGGSLQKRWTPFWLTTRVRTVDANTVAVELKRWRPEDPEPDWSDPRVRRGQLVADGGVETMPTGPGHCALGAAHFFAGSNAAFGTCRFREL